MIKQSHRNKSLEVLKEKPEGARPWPSLYYKSIYTGSPDMNGARKLYYFCSSRECDGWIEGFPNQYNENTLGPLCGRDGKVIKCKRCGYEISFIGYMS
jgi:hypothetical protein